MNPIIAVPTLAIALILIAPPASARDGEPERVVPIITSSCCEAELAEAEALRLSGRLKKAHRQFHAVARRQADAGQFAGEALWQAAEISYILGNTSRTAREMDQVAKQAREFGRPNLEVRALLEATQLHHQRSRNDLAAANLVRIQRLLTSPDVTDETRTLVATRLPGRSA